MSLFIYYLYVYAISVCVLHNINNIIFTYLQNSLEAY